MATKLFWQLAVALAIVTAPTLALAEHGTVGDPLRGQALVSGAPILTISPPRGGYAMLSRDGHLVGWYTQPAVLSLEAGATYTMVAVRGTALVSTLAIVAQPGMTQVGFSDGSDTPTFAYQPPVVFGAGYEYASYGSSAPHFRPRPAAMADDVFHDLIVEVGLMRTDAGRYRVLRRFARRAWFDAAQAEALVAELSSPSYRRSAARLLARRIVPEVSAYGW